jgi:hypothetical protein
VATSLLTAPGETSSRRFAACSATSASDGGARRGGGHRPQGAAPRACDGAAGDNGGGVIAFSGHTMVEDVSCATVNGNQY